MKNGSRSLPLQLRLIVKFCQQNVSEHKRNSFFLPVCRAFYGFCEDEAIVVSDRIFAAMDSPWVQ